ncbi:MAG: SDR family oxidoreductase [Spirochaetota bacterium]|nr:SDR family oxidoreductase [Spirochaetota bacterium]
MRNLNNSVILITGGSRGIGKATCELFSQKAYTVLFTSRSSDNLSTLENEFKLKGAKDVRGYQFDIRDHNQSVKLIETIKKDYNKIDILVNNAGIGIFNSADDMKINEWENVINTNLTGVFYITREVLPLMIEQQKGHIINVGSLASRNTFSGGSAYCASKFGLLGFSECLMLDVRHHNIKVSIIMPGSVETSFMDQSTEADKDTWKLIASDVAEAIYDVVNTRSGHLISRIELRPLKPQKN